MNSLYPIALVARLLAGEVPAAAPAAAPVVVPAASTSTASTAPSAPMVPAAAPGPMRLLVGVMALEGIDAPLDLPVAFAVVAEGVQSEVSTCTDRETCRADARARGFGHIALPRARRLADSAVVVLAIEDLEGRVIAESADAGAPAALTDLSRGAMSRVVTRAVTVLRRAEDPDGDGVGAGDACPTVAGSPQARGCPDEDKDGVADVDDRCPRLAGDAPRGCPDRDHDGIDDAEDRCPDVRGVVAHAGCATAAAIAADPIEVAAVDEGPEWGRIVGGSLGTMLGTVAGGALGFGAAWLVKQQLTSGGNVEFTEFGSAVVYGTGTGVGALLGGLTPDVASAGLCGYPFAASGWTRATHALLVASAAGAGGALVGYGDAKGDQQMLIAGLATLGAAPVLGAVTIGSGNCISGPPSQPTKKKGE